MKQISNQLAERCDGHHSPTLPTIGESQTTNIIIANVLLAPVVLLLTFVPDIVSCIALVVYVCVLRYAVLASPRIRGMFANYLNKVEKAENDLTETEHK